MVREPGDDSKTILERVAEKHDVRPIGTREEFDANVLKFAEFASRNSGKPIPCVECGKNFSFGDWWSEERWNLCKKCGLYKCKKAMGTPKLYMESDLFTDFPQYSLEMHEVLMTRSHWIHGDVGAGKTRLAFAICHALIKSGTTGILFEEFQDIAEKLKGAYKPPRYRGEEQILAPYINAQVLFVDDVYGSLEGEKPTVNEQTALKVLVRDRNNRKAQTIFTSNYEFSQLEKKGFSPRVTSRLAELCKVGHMSGVDRRLQIFDDQAAV